MPSPDQNPAVDLVIVIDTSSSMKDEAIGLSRAAEGAIEAARSHCPADLRVLWLGVEGTWRDTHFSQTIRSYLTETCDVPEASLRGRKRGELPSGGAQEDGARAIEDIANHMDWRVGAKRAMFYLSDEALDGGGSRVEEADIEAANVAIEVAQQTGLTVHTYFGTTRSRQRAALEAEFKRVAEATGGLAFSSQDSLDGFTEVLEKIICTTRQQAVEMAAVSSSVTATAQQGEGEAVETERGLVPTQMAVSTTLPTRSESKYPDGSSEPFSRECAMIYQGISVAKMCQNIWSGT